jgi:hypothetical protein
MSPMRPSLRAYNCPIHRWRKSFRELRIGGRKRALYFSVLCLCVRELQSPVRISFLMRDIAVRANAVTPLHLPLFWKLIVTHKSNEEFFFPSIICNNYDDFTPPEKHKENTWIGYTYLDRKKKVGVN